jgi:hypothetical protein
MRNQPEQSAARDDELVSGTLVDTRSGCNTHTPRHLLIGVAVNAKVDAYIERSEKWPDEMTTLRPILLGCGLTEEIK